MTSRRLQIYRYRSKIQRNIHINDKANLFKLEKDKLKISKYIKTIETIWTWSIVVASNTECFPECVVFHNVRNLC